MSDHRTAPETARRSVGGAHTPLSASDVKGSDGHFTRAASPSEAQRIAGRIVAEAIAAAQAPASRRTNETSHEPTHDQLADQVESPPEDHLFGQVGSRVAHETDGRVVPEPQKSWFRSFEKNERTPQTTLLLDRWRERRRRKQLAAQWAPDAAPAPRRTWRWLLATVLAAIAIGVLFPLTVAALRSLVAL